MSFLSPPLLLMIYFDIDHLLNVTQFLQFLQRFDLPDNLLFLVQKTYIRFASATYAKQTGLPPHLFTTMAEGETLSAQSTYSLQNFGGAVSNALEYNYHLHHCNVLIIMIDTILCFLPFPEFNDFSMLLDLFLNILYIAAEQFPLPVNLHLSTLKWITKHPYNQG